MNGNSDRSPMNTDAPLAVVLTELSECLMADNSDADSVTPRMQTVLLTLISRCTKSQQPKQRELVSVVNLTNLALQRLPGAFSSGECSTALTMLMQLVPLFATASLRPVHETLLETILALTTLTAANSRTAYFAAVTDVVDLIYEMRDILAAFSRPAEPPPEPPFNLTAFTSTAAHIASVAASQATDPVQGESADETPMRSPRSAPLQGVAIAIADMESCQTLAAAALRVFCHCMSSTPYIMKANLAHCMMPAVLNLLDGGFTVQTSVLALLAQAMPVLQPSASQKQMILSEVLRAVATWKKLGPTSHPLLDAWQTQMLCCLERLAIGMPGAALQCIFREMVTVAADSALQLSFRARVCILLTRLASKCDSIHQEVPRLLQGMSGGMLAGSILQQIFEQMKAAWGAKEMNMLLHDLLESSERPEMQGSPHAAKKRRMSAQTAIIDLCSQGEEAQQPASQLPQESKQPQRQQHLSEDCSPAQLQCIGVLKDLVALGDGTSPSANGGMAPHARLQGLKGLLHAIGASLPALLPRLAPAVGEWVSWCLAPVGTADSRLEDVALVLSCVNAFIAAIVALEVSTVGAAPKSSSSARQVRARDLVHGMGLTKEQLKSVTLIPFSSTLGLDEAFSPAPDHKAEHDAELLRAAKVAAVQVQLGAYLFDAADGGNPFAKGNTEAKAAADSDALVRAAAARLAPGFICCSHRHGKALQSGIAALQKLAESPEAEVQLAVAESLPHVICASAAREHRASAVLHACLQSEKLALHPHQSAWQQLESPKECLLPLAPPTAVDVTPNELRDLAEKLLLNASVREDVRAAMLRSTLHCFAVAPVEEVSAAKRLLRRCLRLGSDASSAVRRELRMAADKLARTQFVWGGYGKGTTDLAADDKPAYGKAECRLLEELKLQFQEQDQHEHVQISLLQTIAAAGWCMQGTDSELLVLMVLLDRIIDPNHAVRAIAAELLLGYAARKHAGLQALILGQPKLMEDIGCNLLTKPEWLGEAAILLDMDEKDLALKILPSALAHFVGSGKTDTLQAMASTIGLPLQTLMEDYGHHVVAKYLFEGNADLAKFMAFMEELIKEDFLTFLKKKDTMQKVIMEIITQAGGSKDWTASFSIQEDVYTRVFQMLRELARTQHKTDDVAAFLADRDHVTRILKNYGDTLEEIAATSQQASLSGADTKRHQQVLRCLVLLTRLTGPFLPRFLPQMMVLLSSAVRAGMPDAVKLQSLEGWHTLMLALISHAPTHLASIINQVVVTLLEPLQEGGAVMAAAVRVLDTVIVQHHGLLGFQIKALPPLPQSVPALNEVNRVIAKERGRLTPHEQIQLLLQSLSHHSLIVKATALQELRDYLNKNRQWLASLLAGSSSAASQDGQVQQTALLCSLVSALLKCCDSEARDPIGIKAQLLCAECLGLLGAVDPARLNVKAEPPEALCPSTADLLVELISKHLVRLLRVAPSLPVLDAATFAIQELLRHYGEPDRETGMPRDSTAGRGNTLYAALPEDVQAFVQPYLDSKFIVTGTGHVTTGLVFSASGISFWRWLYQWLRQLVDNHASGELVALFQACNLVMRRDVQTCLFLMPYIIHNVLKSGSDAARQQVKLEIEAVLRGGHTNKEGELCVQAIFSLLDMLKKWSSDLKDQAAKEEASTGQSRSGVSSPAEAEEHTRHITDLIEGIPMDLLAQAAFHCGAHARALQYYETYVRAKEGGALNTAARKSATYTDEDITFLQEAYGRLEEPDGLAGLLCLRRGRPRLQDQILAAEKAGCWTEALSLYDQALKQTPGASSASSRQIGLSSAQRGHLQSLLQMGHLQSVMAQVEGWSMQSDEVAKQQLAATGVAGAWRLGRWDLLKIYLSTDPTSVDVLSSEEVWEMRIGKLLSSISSRERLQTKTTLEDVRKAIMAPLNAASMESYTRAYPFLVKLHMLQELSDAAVLLQEGSVAGPLERQRRLRWEERLKVTQSSFAVQEPILALRRQLAELSGADKEASLCWLQHAKLCRATGHFEAAMVASLEAMSRDVQGASIEHAKLLWDMDQPHRAIIKLQQDLQAADDASRHQLTQLSPEKKQEVNHSKTQMLLQLARWMALTGQGTKVDVTGHFKRAVALEADSEQSYFHYAKYLDQLMQDAKQRQEARASASSKSMDRIGGKSRIQIGEDQPFVEYVPFVIQNYGMSVQCGHRHIYQSLPRLLTVWFEFGTHCVSISGKPSKQARQAQTDVQNVMQRLAKELPLYAWLVALPQLTSRICHPHQPTQDMTQHILTRLTAFYPQQALWALAAVSRSEVTARQQAASSILKTAKKHQETNEGQRKLYAQFPAFCEQLVKLCHHNPGDKNRTMSARAEMTTLVRMMPLAVLVPTNATLGMILPPSGRTEKQHQPFSNAVTIEGMKDRIEVMASLQRPKKVVFIGSDGKEYPFLVKPDDDLRKDSRMMETAGLLNRLFAKDPLSRRRNLYIRRFAVTPLTENCGLIEWVNHTAGLRHCCQSVYKAAGKFDKTSNPTIKAMYDNHKSKRMSELIDRVLAMFPPMLHRFFLSEFLEPASWYNARLAFTRTSAVWCMVGHLLGLGDRHGENILLDTATGDCIHIDFACLFDKGLTLAKPEMVPFRLTQNVVDAFGVSGHEGVFKRVAEITLRVLREHRDTLASVLETFVHDPLVDWTAHGRAQVEDGAENPQAKDAMATIQGRLTGTLLGVRSIPSLPLSVEAQVLRLIEEATDKENLGQMYVWWMAWF